MIKKSLEIGNNLCDLYKKIFSTDIVKINNVILTLKSLPSIMIVIYN